MLLQSHFYLELRGMMLQYEHFVQLFQLVYLHIQDYLIYHQAERLRPTNQLSLEYVLIIPY
jgi:hypothetical protein